MCACAGVGRWVRKQESSIVCAVYHGTCRQARMACLIVCAVSHGTRRQARMACLIVCAVSRGTRRQARLACSTVCAVWHAQASAIGLLDRVCRVARAGERKWLARSCVPCPVARAGERKWFAGTVCSYDPDHDQHRVDYQDGDSQVRAHMHMCACVCVCMRAVVGVCISRLATSCSRSPALNAVM